VWYSTDGISWTLASDSAEFSGRMNHKSVVFNNLIWIIGGWDGDHKNDAWYSSDGISWTLATDTASFSGRQGHSAFVFNNEIN